MQRSLVGIIGLGNLGMSLATMIAKNPDLDVIGHNRSHVPKNLPRIRLAATNREVILRSDVVILSVKPMQIQALCAEIRPLITSKVPIISTAAAVSLTNLKQWLPETEMVIRCMPNIPCSIGEGIVPYYSTNFGADTLMASIFSPNRIVDLETDHQMDVSTMVSGCGPAFLAWFSQYLYEIGTDLPPSKLQALVAQTLRGTGTMLETTSPTTIMRTVASPKGATEASLDILSSPTLQQPIRSALISGLHRIEHIATQFNDPNLT